MIRRHDAEIISEQDREPQAKRAASISVRGEGEEPGLLQRVHKARNRAVQVFVGPTQLFNLVDGM